MMNKFSILLSLLIFAAAGYAQTGGRNTYDFLELGNSARIVSLGGMQVAAPADDINFSWNNPALLSDTLHEHLSLSYVDYLSDVKVGYATYGRYFENIGMFAVGVHFINHGKFEEATATGQLTGNTFSASEYALNIAWSRKINDLVTVGASLRPVFSSLESYNSFGIAGDLGVRYTSPSESFNAALTFKNIGTQITTYYDGAEHEKLPFDVQLGFSQKLAHAPVRLYLTLHHLHNWDLGDLPGSGQDKGESFGKQLMRHVIMGTELSLSENMQVRVGYNYQRREELGIEEKMSTVGFSWGFGLKVSKFRIDYGSARYHLGGSTNVFTVTTDLSQF